MLLDVDNLKPPKEIRKIRVASKDEIAVSEISKIDWLF